MWFEPTLPPTMSNCSGNPDLQVSGPVRTNNKSTNLALLVRRCPARPIILRRRSHGPILFTFNLERVFIHGWQEKLVVNFIRISLNLAGLFPRQWMTPEKDGRIDECRLHDAFRARVQLLPHRHLRSSLLPWNNVAVKTAIHSRHPILKGRMEGR